MDCSAHKIYHLHSFDSRRLLEDYFSGHVKGDILFDLSIGSMIHHLYSAYKFFEHIIVLKLNDRCIMELKRWVDTRTGAFQWGHVLQIHAEIEEKR
ncbi:hypothetical protein GDO81_023994 [Engystomops pustulosus]|uniref:Uncharacterized protein n=1 Tax=Engystomops pustulosus TaxID=76066 RepID=A0AAV6YJR9_ENGPU|nr:hypothetical protein GDO81_023994 [Engystomops pustulosus]